MFKRLVVMCVLVFLAAGCAPDSTTAQVWFDKPLTGSVYSFAGLPPIDVLLHAAHPGGIDRVELLVNGSALAVLINPDKSAQLAQFATPWLPEQAGKYTLQARARANSGVWSGFATTIVIIGELPLREQASPTSGPTRAASTLTADLTPTPLTPTGRSTVALTETPTPPSATATATLRPVLPSATATPTLRPVLPSATATPTRPIPPSATATATRPVPPTSTFTATIGRFIPSATPTLRR